MHGPKALLSVLFLTTITLAGCSGEDTLGITFDEVADPITEAYTFKASGSADRFVWDFGDASGPAEGKEVEHTFGFTDGVITVRVTAEKGEEKETAAVELTLGSGRNTNPEGAMMASSIWVTPGEAISLSGASTTDADGDPILYRWRCTGLGAPLPPHGDSHGPTGGLPFGVNFAGTVGNVSGADRTIDGDLCDGLQDDTFSRDGTVSGAFTTMGVYNIDMEIRDPKSPAFVGRTKVFVTDEKPPATDSLSLAGSLVIGQSGTVQSTMEALGDPIGEGLGIRWDQDTSEITVPIHIKSGVITFTGTGLEWQLTAGASNVVSEGGPGTFDLGPAALVFGQRYTLTVDLVENVNASWTWDLETVNDLKPTYIWESPS